MFRFKEGIVKILRLNEVINRTGIPRSTIYAFMAKDRFPKQINLGCRSVGWIDSEVNEWIEAKVEKARG